MPTGVYERTKQHRRKLTEIFKGRANPFYGRQHTEKAIEKMRIAHKGKATWNKGTKGSMPEPWNKGTKGIMKPNKTSFKKGNHLSEETKLKMSKVQKGRVITWGDKISEARKGHTVSEEVRRKISQTLIGQMAGEKNPNWGKRGPETSSWIDGRSFLPYPVEFNRQLKELIRNRDNYQCQKCGCPEIENMRKLDVHHIDYNKENSLPSNLIALCKSCNSLVNKNREFWQSWFKQKMEVKVENRVTC